MTMGCAGITNIFLKHGKSQDGLHHVGWSTAKAAALLLPLLLPDVRLLLSAAACCCPRAVRHLTSIVSQAIAGKATAVAKALDNLRSSSTYPLYKGCRRSAMCTLREGVEARHRAVAQVGDLRLASLVGGGRRNASLPRT